MNKGKIDIEARIRELCGPVSTEVVDAAVIAALAGKDAVDRVRDENRKEALAAAAFVNCLVELRGAATVETDEVRVAIGAAAQVLARAAGINDSAYWSLDAKILDVACNLRQTAADRLTKERGGPGPGLWLQALREAGEKLPNCIDVAGLVHKTTGLNLKYFIGDDGKNRPHDVFSRLFPLMFDRFVSWFREISLLY